MMENAGRNLASVVLDVFSPGSVVMASLTMTLALPKTGLRHTAEVDELLLADISVPAED